MFSRPFVALGLTAGVLLASLAGTTVAQADPTSTPGTPPAGWDGTDIYASVGADAFAELTNEIAKQYNGTRAPGDGKFLASYDAVNPVTGAVNETITTKPGCTNVVRPNGANGGLSAIKNNATNADGDFCIDWVRSSRPKAASGENALDFYAQSRDAVGYATLGNAYAPTSPLTAAQLKDIFECTTTDWSEVGGQAGAIHVYLPPASAATLTFFLTAIGTTYNNVSSGCGVGTAGDVTFHGQQNDGTTLDGDPQGILPYAITKWAAQLNGAPGIKDLRGGAHIGYVGTTVEPITTKVLSGTTYSVLNPAFTTANPDFGRVFYNVVRSDTPSATTPAALRDVFKPGGFLCTHADELLIPFGNTPLGDDSTGGKKYCGQLN